MTAEAEAPSGRERVERFLARFSDDSEYSRNITMLAGSTAFSQVLTLLISPILTRLYTPASVGAFGVFAAFVTTAASVTCGRYEVAIVSAKSRGDAARLAVIALLTSIPLIVASIFGFGALVHFKLLGFGIVPFAAVWVALASVTFGSAFVALRYWFVREQSLGIVAGVTVAQSAVRSVAQVVTGMLSPLAISLVFADALGRAAALIRILPAAIPSLREALRTSEGKLREVALRYRDYPLIALPSAVLNTMALHIPVPMLAMLYGADAAGQYTIVDRIMAVPLSIISAAIADAFHGRAASYLREDPAALRGFFNRTVRSLLLFGIGPLALVAFLGPLTFTHLFGPRWAAVGPIAAIIAPAALAQLTVTPVSRVVLLYKRGLRLKLLYDLVTLSIAVGVLFGCHALGWSLMHTLMWFSGAIVLRYALYYLIILSLLSSSEERLFE